MFLQNSLRGVFSNSGLNYGCCFSVNCWHQCRCSVGKDFYGIPNSFPKCTLLSIESLESLAARLQMCCSEVGAVPMYESNELNLQLADRYSAGVLDMGGRSSQVKY